MMHAFGSDASPHNFKTERVLELRTANTAPVWRGGMRCFSTCFGGKNWLHISAELY